MKAALVPVAVVAVVIAATAVSAAPTPVALRASTNDSDAIVNRSADNPPRMAVLATRDPMWELLSSRLPSLKLTGHVPAAQPQEVEMELTSLSSVRSNSRSPTTPGASLLQPESSGTATSSARLKTLMSPNEKWEVATKEQQALNLQAAEELLKQRRGAHQVLFIHKGTLSFEWPKMHRTQEKLAKMMNSGASFTWRDLEPKTIPSPTHLL